MAQNRTKKAKLAHEKKGNLAGSGDDSRAFVPNKIVELAEHEGRSVAVVELDEKGTMGLIDGIYVIKDANGALMFRAMACPALYDSIAQQKAVDRYQSFSASA